MKKKIIPEKVLKGIYKKIDNTKLVVGITKMKKVTREAVVIECENRGQVEKLRKKSRRTQEKNICIITDQSLMKKKQKIKIFDVEKEDSEIEQDFWGKINEQNGLRTSGKIIYKSTNRKTKRIIIITEVNDKIRERLLELGKVKIGWKYVKCKNI